VNASQVELLTSLGQSVSAGRAGSVIVITGLDTGGIKSLLYIKVQCLELMRMTMRMTMLIMVTMMM
jgi:hypothetical protein